MRSHDTRSWGRTKDNNGTQKMTTFRHTIYLWVLIPLTALSFDGFGFLPYTSEHMDVGVRIVDGELVGYWKNDFAVVNGVITAPDFPAAGLRALGVFDAETLPMNRPAPSAWDFLGVAAGEPIYILPSGGVPNTLPYLGLSTEDPSLSPLGADEYRFTLVDMTGPENGVFSLFAGSANVPMNTLNGFPAGSILIEAGDHLHYNWGFSHPGTYDLYFQFEALSGTTVIATGSDTFRFQITDGGGFDDYEHWRRTVFTPEQIADESISGPNATPLNDGVSNMQRFAFGDEARFEWIWIEEDGDLSLELRSFMRHDSGMEFSAQYATQLVPPDWDDVDITLEETERVFHDPGMERRTYRINPPDAPASFFRLRSQVAEP